VYLEEKPVELRLGKGKRPLQLNGILGRYHKKGPGEQQRLAVHGDLPLLHAFEKAGLGARNSAVDLVGEEDIGHDRPGLEGKTPVLLAVDIESRNVRGEQIRRELHPLEYPADASGEGLGDQCFPQAGDILQQHVPVRQKAHEQQFHDGLLAHDHLRHILHDTVTQTEIRHCDSMHLIFQGLSSGGRNSRGR